MINIFDNVKKLREITGISIVDCKKALLASNNDIDKAIVFLRKNSVSAVSSKAGRLTGEGLICIKIDNGCGVILELNCETDFVSKSNEFKSYGEKVCDFFVFGEFEKKSFLVQGDDVKLSQELIDLKSFMVSRFGENIVVRRVLRIFSESGFLFKYVHFGRIGVILNINDNNSDLALSVLMQIAAMNPKYIDISSIPENVLLYEKSIYFDKIKNQYPDKSDVLLNNMLDGQLKKYFKENVLLEQAFIKDNKINVKQFLNEKIIIHSFVRFELGEN